MQIAPNIKQTASSVKGFFVALGFPMSIALIAFVAVALWYLIGYASEGYTEHQADKQIDAYKKQTADALALARQKEDEMNQALGAASAYKAEAEALENERTILLQQRPELAARVASASKQVEAIRNRPLVPVSGDMRQRVEDLGAKLDKLYPDQ
jgi:F0F1-type ATP synthase membrane subunit b/b'